MEDANLLVWKRDNDIWPVNKFSLTVRYRHPNVSPRIRSIARFICVCYSCRTPHGKSSFDSCVLKDIDICCPLIHVECWYMDLFFLFTPFMLWNRRQPPWHLCHKKIRGLCPIFQCTLGPNKVWVTRSLESPFRCLKSDWRIRGMCSPTEEQRV